MADFVNTSEIERGHFSFWNLPFVSKKSEAQGISRKLARPRLNAPPHPTPSDCALFVLFCAMVINICACMITFLFYIFLGPANFTPTYPHKDIGIFLFGKSLDLFCAYLCCTPRRRYSRRSRERRCSVGRPTSRLPTHSSEL